MSLYISLSKKYSINLLDYIFPFYEMLRYEFNYRRAWYEKRVILRP